MEPSRLTRGAWLALAFCCAMLSPAGTLLAATLFEFVDPNPAPENVFGQSVVPLSTGNVVITSPGDDAGGTDAGAVYLFNGATGELISTLRGSHVNDRIGEYGVTALTNGNFVVASAVWDNGAVVDAGAVTWGSGTTGVSGVVSAANSLVGSTAGDQVASSAVTALSNGNYVVRSPSWHNGAVVSAGAVTWGSGTTGVSGVVSAANSLVGSTAGDAVGDIGLAALTNGNYVVASPNWDNGALANVGAATWGSGTAGVSGVVSADNSLVGSTAEDRVGSSGVTALTSANYVVASSLWDSGAVNAAGAATWCSGTTGFSGEVSPANSLVGSKASDQVGDGGATALSNGNYVVASRFWTNGAAIAAGATTWGSGTSGVTGVVSAANSLVGSKANDNVGSGGVTALTNGNYVVASQNWDNGAVTQAGAATWGSGTTGVTGAVSTANSLVGSTTNNSVAGSGVTALANGNYVVRSQFWDGAIPNVGAATWGNGTTGLTGVVSAANSLVGSASGDQVGSGLTALSNGNYVVVSDGWGVANEGAATFGSGTTGASGPVSAANSLVGSTAGDQVGNGGVTALANGNYVVASGNWDNGGLADVGAVTWGSGTSGVTGVVSAANSLVGSASSDLVGNTGVTALTNGNYVIRSPNWNNGATLNAGAATWGSGTTGATGVISLGNSLLGTSANAGQISISADDASHTFIARWPAEGGGRLRVGPQEYRPVIENVVDMPADQGGWVRLTFHRAGLDAAISLSPVATYAVWRRVPGTLPAGALHADQRAALGAPLDLDSPAIERLWAVLPAGLDVRESDGRFFVLVTGSPASGVAAAFPPGTWELMASVPALQQAQYVIAVPTISNAVSDFVVTAHTTTPSIWYASDPVSGYSFENQAPATPTELSAHYDYLDGQTNLQWAANPERDVDFYNVYRGASEDFVPSLANWIAEVATPHHEDVGPAGSFYKVSATDVNGNESGFALIGPNQTTDVGDDRPVVFSLAGVRPNPTNGRGLHVAFALPTGAAARLELLDVSGRRVLAREVGSLGAGRHTVDLAEGRSVAPGLYWLRLAQGPNRRTTRVVVSD